VVEPEDENRFLLTAREAAGASAQTQNDKELLKEFNDLLIRVHAWCENHADSVVAAYVYGRNGLLNVVICTVGEHYRFDLDDAVTDLDLSLAQHYPSLASQVIQIPETARKGNLSLEKALIVYGDGSGTQQSSNA